MLAASASLLNIDVVILDVGENAPAKQVVLPSRPELGHINGSFTDPEKILELAKKVDVLTVEIEHVNVDSLDEVQRQLPNLPIHPSPTTIRVIQDKLKQKRHLVSHNCPVGEFVEVSSDPSVVRSAIEKFGLPLMLKSRTLAYDGRGNVVIRSDSEIEDAIASLGDRPLYAEKWMPFVKEIAVMVVRSTSGEVRSYPAVETVHKDNICHLVFAPFRYRDASVASRACSIAEGAVKTFPGAGVFGVEMFLMKDGEFASYTWKRLNANQVSGSLFINEIAPRPHNSGHYTIEACATSQYSNHLRTIASLPLGSTAMSVPSAVMMNIIGHSSSPSEITSFARKALEVPGASVHLYGKRECRKGRKMGHVTLVANSDHEMRQGLRSLLSALPGGYEEDCELYSPVARRGHNAGSPLVGIIMGSDSDLPVMLPAATYLERFNVPYELTIVSAHRTPDRMVEYSRCAASRGLRVVIAGAGGAAHLPGMVAAMTPLPVIGVPVKGSTLDGVDSLHSIVQMPVRPPLLRCLSCCDVDYWSIPQRGVPVATVAINNSTNAGLLAVRILGTSIPEYQGAMQDFMQTMEGEVLSKVERMTEVGWWDYQVAR